MNGDLSLSKTLGGLRIANIDDDDTSPPAPAQSQDTARQALVQNASAGSTTHQAQGPSSSYYAEPTTNPDPSSITTSPPIEGRLFGSRQHTYESAAAILKSAQSSLNAAQQRQMASSSTSEHSRPQYAPSHSNSTSSTHHTGNPRPHRTAIEAEQAVTSYSALRNEPARSSTYGTQPRGDARSNAGNGAPDLSRESSHRDRTYDGPRVPQAPGSGPGSGPPPPRRSSRGMGGGYASIPGIPMAAPSSSNYESEAPLMQSSEAWREAGAAVSVRREVDPSGRPVMRTVKKGVKDFSFGRVLGEGSYSTVYLATDRQSLKEYAIKVLEKKHIIKEKKIKYVNIEKNTLNRLTEHPGIVRLYYTFQDESSLYYVLDLCNGGELLGVLKRTGTFDVECTRFYGAQILDSIEYMHSRGVIHRDLKPENVLLDDNMHIKITDFGTAKLLPDPRDPRPLDSSSQDPNRGENGRAASFVGTAEYVSPELLTDKSASKASDLWAFGCIIYQLLAGRPPFKGASEYLTFQKIVGLEYEFPKGFPPAARDLVERCLVLEPSRRLTVEHIKNHEFFDGQPFGKELWKTKAPRLRPYQPPPQEPHIIQLNSGSSTPQAAPTASARGPAAPSNGSRPTRLITELPPPTQLDLEWSPVLTRQNERILRIGDLMVISSPIPNSPHAKDGDGHKKLSRFFGGSTTKKRPRTVIVTTNGRIILAPPGGDDKRAKQEVSLLASDCAWRTQVDVKGANVWCVDTGGIHYTFEELKGSSAGDLGKISTDEWIEALEKAKDFALSSNIVASYRNDDFGDVSSSMSSPASTLGGRGIYPEGFGEGFSVSDRSGRNPVLSKSQVSLEEPIPERKRNRFSKRASRNGLGAQF